MVCKQLARVLLVLFLTAARAGAQQDAATVTGAQSTTYAAVRDTEAVPGVMNLVTGGWGATDLIRAGTVFTIGTITSAKAFLWNIRFCR